MIFLGCIKGTIVPLKGSNDFPWDPIFQPEGYTQTYAEMDAELKNSISDRGLAVKSLLSYLKQEHFNR
jgi:inosine triphosphate pyrophosphatase